jgi:hypothetical protein
LTAAQGIWITSISEIDVWTIVDSLLSDHAVARVCGGRRRQAEVPRRVLIDTEIRTLLRTEVDDRLLAAEQMDGGGHSERAAAVRAEAAVLADLLNRD